MLDYRTYTAGNRENKIKLLIQWYKSIIQTTKDLLSVQIRIRKQMSNKLNLLVHLLLNGQNVRIDLIGHMVHLVDKMMAILLQEIIQIAQITVLGDHVQRSFADVARHRTEQIDDVHMFAHVDHDLQLGDERFDVLWEKMEWMQTIKTFQRGK